MKGYLIYLISLNILAFSLFFPKTTKATTNPLSQPNNKYGIHIISENDLESAEKLVNSSNGSWGYVTFVIREDERDLARWTNVFQKLSELKLIPIVRLATTTQNLSWQKPNTSETKQWAKFLSQLPWPIQNRYIILFNEPNHAKEWGGDINPTEYAHIARIYWEELKKASFDFFVLPAGFDLSATNSKDTLSAESYWQQMFLADELIFTIFDGWNSHSYPNPNFCGNPKDTGRSSLTGYLWETNILENQYFLLPNTPLFITETGWGCDINPNVYQEAFETIWVQPNIVAVTPFILNYEHFPFNHFSWLKNNETTPTYTLVQSLAKIKGEPILSKSQQPLPQFISSDFPKLLLDYKTWLSPNVSL